MPGNRALYDRAMEVSREAARMQQWDDALKQAVRALQEFPQDADARSSAAVALYHTGRYPQALQVFEDLRNSDQSNPFFLEYIARIQEQSGNTEGAVSAYRQLADLQHNRRLVSKVIEAIREILRLQPDDEDQRARLAGLLAEANDRVGALNEYLELARQAQQKGNLEQAAGYAESALRADPNSREAKEHIAALHAALADATQTAMDQGEAPPPLPSMISGGIRAPQASLDRIVAQAQEYQEAGDSEAAIAQYERAVALGLERSDVFYSLGLLQQERGSHQEAVAALRRATNDPEYTLSAHYSLGSSYEALGQLSQAAQEYDQTLRLIDLQTIGRTEADDLIQMYESAANVYSQINDIARAAGIYSDLAAFLASKRWGKERADEFRRKAKELTDRNMFAKLRMLGTGALTTPEPQAQLLPEPQIEETMPETWGKIRPITDFLRGGNEQPQTAADDFFGQQTTTVSAAIDETSAALDALPPAPEATFAPLTALETAGLDDTVVRYIQASEKYIEQKLFVAALDTCMEVIRMAPDYLPIHLRMGEIYERKHRIDEALAKYQLLVEAHLSRNEPRRAIDVYYRLIELSPDTVNARSRLADLLKNDNRVDAAAEQLSIVAGAYFRMGQTNKSLEEYRRGLQWAPNSAKLHAQYGQALLKLERYEAALVEFRRALELNQRDIAGIARINATLALMGEQPVAVWQSLASLLEQLKANPQALNETQAEYRAALLVSDQAILHYILGVVQQQASQHQSALLEFEQAAELLINDEDPMLPPVLVHQAMADSYIALGQADDALAQLQQSLSVATKGIDRLDPSVRYPFATPLSQGDLVRRMAEAHAASGDISGAEHALQEAKKHLPYDRTIYTKLADIYFRQGKLTEALAQLEELATHYEERQDIDRAIETLEYGIRLAPHNITIGKRLAQFNLRRGYLDKGVDGLIQVAELQRRAGQLKEAVASLQQASDVHWTLGKYDKAQELYDKIIKIAPNDVDARQWLSFMYTLAGRTESAIEQKKQLVRLFLAQRDYESAIAELHQLYGLNQNDPDTLFQLGDVLMRREEYDQAVRIYERLSKMPNVESDRVEAFQSAARRMLAQQQARAKST